ncbi:MAG: hypothetical protein U1D30_22640 [Planctomycetota bacterium]
MVTKQIPENTRKAIFRELVEVEDGGATPVKAREEVANKFQVSPEDVREIAMEGLDKTWPPLEDCD